MSRCSLGLLTLLLVGCPPAKVEDDSEAPHGTPDACDATPEAVICQEGVALTCDELGDVVESASCDPASELCYDGAGCLSCAPILDLSLSDAAAARDTGAYLPVDDGALDSLGFATAKLAMRALVVSTADALPSGTVTLSADTAGLEVFDASGELLLLPASLDAATLPQTLYVRAISRGATTLSVSADGGCPATDAVVFRAGTRPSLTGRTRSTSPSWWSTHTINATEPMMVALDPSRWSDRVGLSFDLYVVEHRSPRDWASDPSLVDVSGTVETATVSAEGLEANTWTAWESPDPGEGVVGAPYDVVLDFGRNGQLDAGDLVEGLETDRAGVYVLGDLSEPGPHEVLSFDHDSDLLWRDERIYYPADIADMGRLPLVVVSHGNGHDYTWYDYLGEHLASWGYVVMSHQNNTGPGIETASGTTLENTDYLLLQQYAMEDGVLGGHIDAAYITWIGHSRGGEGVVRAYDRMADGEFTPGTYGPEDIRLIVSIAPTVFYEVTESDPHDRPYHIIAGTADGDVTGGVDCPQCQFFRISAAAQGPVSTGYVQGASHNDFNCCGFADGTGPDLIGRDEVQVIAKSYILALIQAHIDGNPAAAELIAATATGFRPLGLADDDVIATTWRDAHSAGYPIVDDFQSNEDADLSSSGGVVSATVSDVDEADLRDLDMSFTWDEGDPMNGASQAVYGSDLARGLVFDWDAEQPGSLSFEVPVALQDWSDYGVVSLAAAQGTRHTNTVELAAELDFTVVLVDALGVESAISIADSSPITQPYQRSGSGAGRGWADEFNTVRLPLTDFEIGSTLDLSQIAAVRLDFGGDDGTALGRLVIDNVELSR